MEEHGRRLDAEVEEAVEASWNLVQRLHSFEGSKAMLSENVPTKPAMARGDQVLSPGMKQNAIQVAALGSLAVL